MPVHLEPVSRQAGPADVQAYGSVAEEELLDWRKTGAISRARPPHRGGHGSSQTGMGDRLSGRGPNGNCDLHGKIPPPRA